MHTVASPQNLHVNDVIHTVGGKLSRCVAVMGPRGHLDWGERRIQNFILLLYTWVSIMVFFVVKFVLKPCHWICMIWIWCVTTKIAQFIFHPTTSWAPSCYPEPPNRTHHKIYKTNYKFSKILFYSNQLYIEILLHTRRLRPTQQAFNSWAHLLCTKDSGTESEEKLLEQFWWALSCSSFQLPCNYLSISSF